MQAMITRRRRPTRSSHVPRGRRIVRVRAAIRAGEYENALKLNITVDRLLEALLPRT
jgi:hypothetical protein